MQEVFFQNLDETHRTAVLNIYNHYIEHSFASFIEKKADDNFYDVFLSSMHGYPACAIIYENKTIGFCFLRPYSPIPAFKSTAEISYYIHPSFTRKGVGTQALGYLIGEAKKHNIKHLIAQVSSLNQQGIAFHTKNGFLFQGRLEKIGEKFGQTFDVIIFQKTIS